MFKANPMRIARASTGGHAASPARRRFLATVSIAAMIACGLFAAPLQADHETLNVVVTLEATPGDGYVTLRASQVGLGDAVDAGITGYHFREQFDGAWDDSWWNMGSDGSSTVSDLVNGTAYTYQARAYKVSVLDGQYHYVYSDSSAAVTVTPTAPAQ